MQTEQEATTQPVEEEVFGEEGRMKQ